MDQIALKQTIRADVLLQRKRLTAVNRQRKSQKIVARLLRSDQFQRAHTIHIYLSNAVEVETTSLIRTALQLKKRVAIPVIDTEKKSLTFSVLTCFEDDMLEIGPFGIPQPRTAFQKQISPHEIDLWSIPGVAFDCYGNRLGYGGGYYDRILCHIKKPMIGLAFEIQIIDHLPVESTDVPVDLILTEKRTIFCGKSGSSA